MFSSKVNAALTAGLLFFLVSSPMTYKLVDSVIGSLARAVVPGYSHFFTIAHAGCPTTYGLFVHSAVFSIVVYLMMKH
jgi:hypothetical protein